MLDHVSITVPELDAVAPFYDAIMAALGVTTVRRSAERLGYGELASAAFPARTYLTIRVGTSPERGARRHWCLKASTRTAVDAFWQAGLRHGGVDDGAPGLRAEYHSHYYAAFLCDPAGNRIEAVCHAAAP